MIIVFWVFWIFFSLLLISWTFLAYYFYQSFFVITPKLEDTILEIQSEMKKTLETMRQIDHLGAFESDDEVGFAFKSLLVEIEKLNILIQNE
jgi:hypothetical protein